MSLKSRIILILYIVSITASIFIFAFVMNDVTFDAEYDSYSYGSTNGSFVYFAQNVGDAGRIFRINDSGRVSRMFSTESMDEDERVAGIGLMADGVYAVLSRTPSIVADDDASNDDEGYTYYRIIRMNESLKLQDMTEEFAMPANVSLTGFSPEGTGLFLTFITDSGRYVQVYGVADTELKTEDALNGDAVRMENVRSKTADADRFFVQARYAEGILDVRTDGDAPTRAFALDPRIASAVSRMRLSLGQTFRIYFIYFIWYVAILAIWCVLLYLLIRLFSRRNRMFYYFAIGEAVLFVITAVGVFTIARATDSARQNEHARFAVLSLMSLSDTANVSNSTGYGSEDFYDTDRYHRMQKTFADYMALKGNSDIFYDVLVVRMSDDVVMASASGRNLQSIESIFGSGVSGLSGELFKGAPFASNSLTIDNQTYRAVAVPDSDGVSRYMCVGIINDNSTAISTWVDNSGAIILFVLVFVAASLALLWTWYLQNRDLLLLERALADTALGKELPERPSIIGSDVKDMWDSLTEIYKRVEELQYSKLRILEAYYRFAPKNIEKMLNKESILDVRNGDSIVLKGTTISVSMTLPGGVGPDRFDRLIGRIGEYQREHDGIMISKSPDLNLLQMFVPESERNVVEYLTEISGINNQNHDKVGLSVVAFFDRSSFGVTGTDEETSIYLDSDHKQVNNAILTIVSQLGLGLVITGDVKEREHVEGQLRFIGYAYSPDGDMPLYEVLDAYPASVRARKIASLPKFNEALNSYYDKDFYISRTLFSDILKDMPEDALVKWYVFESDKYLNESVDENSFHILHE